MFPTVAGMVELVCMCKKSALKGINHANVRYSIKLYSKSNIYRTF